VSDPSHLHSSSHADDDGKGRQSVASDLAATAHRVEQVVERQIEHGIEVAEQTIVRRFGLHALRVVRGAVRLTFWSLVVVYFAFGALLLVTRYAVLPRVDQWRPHLEGVAGRALNGTVTIGRIDAGWRAFNPHLALTDVEVVGPRGGTPLALPRVDATVSWWSLATLQPRFSALRVLSPEVTITRLADGTFSIAGFVLEPGHDGTEGSAALDWLLVQKRFAVRDAVVSYRDERATPALELELRDLNLVVEQSFTGHALGLQARPSAVMAGALDVRATVRTGAFARPSHVSQWTGEVFGQLDFADLGLLARFFELPASIDKAQGAVRAWISFDAGAITRSTADVALLDAAARLAPDLQPLQIASLQGRLTQRRWGDVSPAGHGGQEYGLVGTTFRTAAGLLFPPIDLKLRVTRRAGDLPQRTELEASRIDLESLAAVVTHVPLPRDLRERIARQSLRGTLSSLALAWSGDAPALEDLTLKTRFDGLTSAAQPVPDEAGSRAVGQPGFENLSGSVRMERGSGTLDLAATDATLTFPGVFEEPRIALRQLAGVFQWKRANGLEVRFDGLRANNEDFDVSGNGSWRSATSGLGTLDVGGRLTRASAAAAFRYIPRIAGEATRNWLEHALVRGRLSEGTYRIRGDLGRFPFVNPADGEFRISGRVAGAALDVHPAAAHSDGTRPPPGAQWPLLTDIDAELVFERASMKITAQRGSAYGARIDGAVARIDHLGHDATLNVRGTASGPLADMVRYANQSPVTHWIGHVTEGANVQGPARLELDLQIPLGHASDSKVNGTLALNGNAVTLAAMPAFTRVVGNIGFTERGVRIANLTANALGGPLRIDATTRPDRAQTFVASGVATSAGLRSAVPVGPVQRLLDRSHGMTRYQATLSIKDGMELRIDSDLIGLAIDGIAPARKNAQESLPLHVERTSHSAGDDLLVQAGAGVGVRIERRLERGELRISRGVIALNEPAHLPDHGLRIVASMPRLDVDAWSNLLGVDPAAERATSAARSPDDLSVDFIALRTSELLIYGHRFRDVTLGATRAADGSYSANVSSAGASGFVTWRPATDSQTLGQLTARLSRLSIPASNEKAVVEALRAPPKQIPSVEISVDDFELGAMKLGHVDLVAHNTGIGAAAVWRIRKLDITNPDMKIAATGDWAPLQGAAARRAQLRFTLEASDTGGALARFGFPGALSRGVAKLEGEVGWLGSPLDIDYPTLAGRVSLAVDNGRFLKVDPGSAARLLALLSLQSLSRTVAVDAGRQFGEGFAFGSIRADAKIERGVLQTENFRMNGENAAVLMSGAIDLRNETQQLVVVVLPEIDASTAAVALGVANPVLGLGAFLAQFVLRDPLAKAFAIQYDVAGSWTDPRITRRSRITPASTTETVR
jgi:uncharacterized protein (TIGR02099 family)